MVGECDIQRVIRRTDTHRKVLLLRWWWTTRIRVFEKDVVRLKVLEIKPFPKGIIVGKVSVSYCGVLFGWKRELLSFKVSRADRRWDLATIGENDGLVAIIYYCSSEWLNGEILKESLKKLLLFVNSLSSDILHSLGLSPDFQDPKRDSICSSSELAILWFQRYYINGRGWRRSLSVSWILYVSAIVAQFE